MLFKCVKAYSTFEAFAAKITVTGALLVVQRVEKTIMTSEQVFARRLVGD